MNLSDLIARCAAELADNTLMMFERQTNGESGSDRQSFRQTLSYRELDAQVDQACHFLAEQELRPGDSFNLHLPNCPAFIILWFAAARLGAITRPTNVLSSPDELIYLLGHSNEYKKN